MWNQKENLYFSHHQAEILPKLPTHEIVTLIEYQLNWMKIVEFLQIGYF